MKQEFVDRIVEATAEAKGIAWDNCHKIYILMDDAEMALMREYEYDPLISSDQMGPDEMTAKVIKWYEDSCSLRFINACSKADGFVDVIGQFEDEDEDDDDECESCGRYPVYYDGLCDDCRNEQARAFMDEDDPYPSDEMLKDDEAQVLGNLT